MNSNYDFSKAGVIVLLSVTLSACVVAPEQPIGYRMTSSVLPTYVNGQYVGMQPSDYVPPPAPQPTPLYSDVRSTSYPVTPAPTVVQQTPVYTPPPVQSVVYVQNPTPWDYNSYYYPTYVDPWYNPAVVGLGVGLGVGIGFNYYRGGWCCRHGGWGRRGWRR